MFAGTAFSMEQRIIDRIPYLVRQEYIKELRTILLSRDSQSLKHFLTLNGSEELKNREVSTETLPYAHDYLNNLSPCSGKLLRILVKNGADVTCDADTTGKGRRQSFIHHMVWCDCVPCFKWLQKQTDIAYPLNIVASMCSDRIMKYLLETEKVDVHTIDDKGHTPMWYLERMERKGRNVPNQHDFLYATFPACKKLLLEHGS